MYWLKFCFASCMLVYDKMNTYVTVLSLNDDYDARPSLMRFDTISNFSLLIYVKIVGLHHLGVC